MQLIKDKWTAGDVRLLEKYLFDKSKENIGKYNRKLIFTQSEIAGVSVPDLRIISREICKGNFRSFFECADSTLYEVNFIRGLVLGYGKLTDDELKAYLIRFSQMIDNWAVCDCCASTFKIIGKNPDYYYPLTQNFIESSQEFVVRLGVVILMNFFINDVYIDRAIESFDKIKSDQYYVQMGVAWALSVCFVKYKVKTLEYLKTCNLDDFTYNKTLQKIIESNRVEKETKDMIRAMKRKIVKEK